MLDDELSKRIKDHLPTVLLTLLSIVQALALELMWAHLAATDYLYTWSFVALLSWLQISATFVGVLLVWLIYSTMVMRYRWIPTTGDMVFPFLVGIMEFLLIESLGPIHLGAWFITLAVVFGTMTWSSQASLRRARLDGDNDALFAQVEPATLRDFVPAALTVGSLFCVGLVLWVSENQGWFALIVLASAMAALGAQMKMTDTFWRRSVRPVDD